MNGWMRGLMEGRKDGGERRDDMGWDGIDK
jgi:hypothetical protein